MSANPVAGRYPALYLAEKRYFSILKLAIMNDELKHVLKADWLKSDKLISDIPDFLNHKFMDGDNLKYMQMYNWMSSGYDIVETIIGKFKYGNQVTEMRKYLMDRLEWKDDISVLYVSIGTGKDLELIPKNINQSSLKIFGADISIGMLKKCRTKYRRKLNISLVNCCAEDLPFEDNSFDMVFHVGGINFFNDKHLAINEMVRVAKMGSRILIADETNDLIEKQYRKSSFSRKYFRNASMDLSAIENLIPQEMNERKTDILWDGRFYCITFRKNDA